VARGRLNDPRRPDRVLDGPLEDRLVKVVATPLTGQAIQVEACRREDPLPSPTSAGVRVFAQERAGQLDPASTMPEVAVVLPAHALEVGRQVGLHRGRQHGRAILVSLAIADGDLVQREVNVLHAQAAAFQQALAPAAAADGRQHGHLLEGIAALVPPDELHPRGC
jgi:hypothetical protein